MGLSNTDFVNSGSYFRAVVVWIFGITTGFLGLAASCCTRAAFFIWTRRAACAAAWSLADFGGGGTDLLVADVGAGVGLDGRAGFPATATGALAGWAAFIGGFPAGVNALGATVVDFPAFGVCLTGALAGKGTGFGGVDLEEAGCLTAGRGFLEGAALAAAALGAGDSDSLGADPPLAMGALVTALAGADFAGTTEGLVAAPLAVAFVAVAKGLDGVFTEPFEGATLGAAEDGFEGKDVLTTGFFTGAGLADFAGAGLAGLADFTGAGLAGLADFAGAGLAGFFAAELDDTEPAECLGVVFLAGALAFLELTAGLEEPFLAGPAGFLEGVGMG